MIYLVKREQEKLEEEKKAALKQDKLEEEKKAAFEKLPSECPLNLSLTPERVSIEMEPKAEDVFLIPDDQPLTMSVDASSIALKSRMDVV